MKNYHITLIFGLLLLACGVLLGLAAKGAGPLPGDLAVSRLIQSALPFNDAIATAWKWIGVIVQSLPYAVIVILLLMGKWDSAVLVAAASLPIIFFGEAQLKLLFARPRPTADLVTIYQASGGFSFPGGTALQSMSVVGMVIYQALSSYKRRPNPWARRISSIAILFLLICNLARVHVGAHWASDIFGGWLLGGAWVVILIAAYQWRRDRNKKPLHF